MPEYRDRRGNREQQVLFQVSLDEVVPENDPVRLFAEVMDHLDFSAFKSVESSGLGRPTISPQVMASVILWGLLTRIRSSRQLEDALRKRVDFMWLTGQDVIDHSTLCEFRKAHPSELKKLFQEVVLVGQELGLVNFQRQSFDGTRMKANNRRSGTRTLESLERELASIGRLFEELNAALAAADAQDELIRVRSTGETREELVIRQAKVQSLLAEIKRLEAAQSPVPNRLPITDTDSRMMPNKEGGFAPNYTPTAMTDVGSGMIIASDVCAETGDEGQLLPALEQIQEMFGEAAKPKEVLVDGAFPTGYNLEQLEEAGITCYSPMGEAEVADPTNHPAQRADLTQPVSAEQLKKLPTNLKPNSKKLTEEDRRQFSKSAFKYDAENDVYYCPQGKPLAYRNTSPEKRPGQPATRRRRYEAQAVDCAECPLKKLCLQGNATKRTVSRDQYEPVRERHAARMAQASSKKIYDLRRHASETPFAFIKQQMGARQFLLRGIEKVRQEWCWMTCAFNIRKLLTAITQTRAGPAHNPNTMPAMN